MHIKIVGALMDEIAASALGTAKQLGDQADDMFRMVAGSGDYWDDDGGAENLKNHHVQWKKTGVHTDGLHAEHGQWGGAGEVSRSTRIEVLRGLA